MVTQTNLDKLLRTIKPVYNEGEYVFCLVNNLSNFNSNDIIMLFKENEGYTVIVEKEIADKAGLQYGFILAWITLSTYSSVDSVGFTAAFSNALAQNNISCNVVASYHHDHIFVNKKDIFKSIEILNVFSE